MLEYIVQFGLRVMRHTAIAVQQIQVRQIAADGSQHHEQTAANLTWQAGFVRPTGRMRGRARRTLGPALRHRLSGNHPDQRVSEIVHEI